MQVHNYNQMSLTRKQNSLTYSISTIKVLALFLLSWTSIMSVSGREIFPGNTDFQFQITVQSDEGAFNLEGESELMITPSSYSINMIEDDGRCVIHMLNFTTAPGPGTYDVENDDKVKTAMVCMLEGVETRERLASHKGTFTITELTNDYMKGHFDMMLIGPITRKEFHFEGKVKADITPMHLQFGPKKHQK